MKAHARGDRCVASQREILYENEGSFFVVAQSLKLSFWGHQGHFAVHSRLFEDEIITIGFVLKFYTRIVVEFLF